MRFHTGLVFLFTVLCVWSRPLIAVAGAPTEAVDAGALVTKVEAGKKPRVTIDKGKRAGIKVGDSGELFPMHVSEGSTTSSVDFNVRVATGKVVAVTDTTATLALDAVVDTVEAGAYFSFKLTVPSALAQSTLFRLTALGIELRPQYEDTLYTSLEQMLADPSEAARNKVLDKMIADIHAMRDVIVDTLKDPIQEGKYHGKTSGQIVDALDRAQLEDFLLFVEAFPGKYIAHRWKAPEVYFTWIINNTPSGERSHAVRLATANIRAAEAATEAGKLDEARAQWQLVLKAVPDHKPATKAVKQIDQILLLTRTLIADPDDTATGYSLANELFMLGAYDLAIAKLAPLVARKYEPTKVERLRAQIWTRQEKFKEAAEVFKKLAKDKPDDKNLGDWLAYTKAKARVTAAPRDASAYMELAETDIATKSWDAALAAYRSALEKPNITPKQREAAKAAQERIAIQKEIDDRLDWARDSLTKHDVKGVRDRVAQITKLAEKAGDAKRLADILDELANSARADSEEELALELATTRVQSAPTDGSAQGALAFALLGFDRLDEAEAVAKKATELKGDPNYAYLILAYIARARGDLAEMEKLAQRATQGFPRYAWPLIQLARAEAARGEWDDALAHAKKALEIDGEQSEFRSTHLAVTRGVQAVEGLRTSPNSPRERLRLVRALAELGLPKRVAEEIAKLPADGEWRNDGWWALMVSPDPRVLLQDRLAAARALKTTSPYRKRMVVQFELRTALRANPKDDATRIALAKNYIVEESFDLALATLGPLMTQTPMKAGVGDLVRDAREGIASVDQQNLATAAQARHDWDNTMQLALAIQKTHDRIGTLYGRLVARQFRMNALSETGKHAEAIALAKESKQIAEATGNLVNVSYAEQQIGRLESLIGTNDAHRKALEDARTQCEDQDEDAACYAVLMQLTQLARDDGQAAVSIDSARKAWNLAERMGRADYARNARFELANGNLNANRLTDAEQLAIKLLADSRKASDVGNEELSLMVLGYVAMMRGQGKQARDRFQEVYDLGTRIGDKSFRAVARRFQGSSWLVADHDYAKAVGVLEQANELYTALGEGWAQTVRSSILRDLADARLQAGKLGPARQAAEEATQLAQRFQRTSDLAASQWILALVALTDKKADVAIDAAQKALALAQKTDDDGLLWNVWYVIAKANDDKGQSQAAVDGYEKALEFLGRALQATGGESERQAFMNTGRVRQVYTDAVNRFLAAGKTARAMEVLELSRDAMLKQKFDPTKIATKDAKLRARLDKYDDARQRVKGLQQQLDQAMAKPAAQRSEAQVKALSERIAQTRQELNQVVLDLKVTHRHLFQALAMDPQNLVGRRAELPSGSVLVEYFVADDALYAFVIAANLSQPAVVRVKVASAELEKTIADWREAIVAEGDRSKQRDRVEELGRKLGDWLLEPLRPHIESASAVILLPFGSLYYVPFDALIVSPKGQPVRYAIEDYRISIQTATTLEHLLRPTPQRGSGTMLAVSNPDGSLPGAQQEVSRIVKTALPDAQVLARNQATVKKFTDMAGNYRFLHLATHGILDADPRKSYMKLSDGPLTVEMISRLQGLDQANELVVLSACDTAVEAGKSTGDELVSIAVGFSMAGAPTLVASLWEVSDESTAELMAQFYKALETGKGDRLDALRNAKLALLRLQRGTSKPFAEPWHWSSFQMYGDYRPTVPAK